MLGRVQMAAPDGDRDRQVVHGGRDGRGRAGSARGQPDSAHPPGRRGRRAARVPARRPGRQDRPLPAAALRRPVRHGRRRGRPAAGRPRHGRGGAARLHARPHAQQQLHHPRRGAEHDGRADEDVPHPHRVRVQGRGHRRHDPGRPAQRPQRHGRPRAHPRRHRRPGLRAPFVARRRAPPHRAGDRRRLRAGRPGGPLRRAPIDRTARTSTHRHRRRHRPGPR